MECNFPSHTIPKGYSGYEHLIASMQPRKYSNNFKTELQKKPKTTSEVLEEPAVLSYEELRDYGTVYIT
jgi:hypothetical protein